MDGSTPPGGHGADSVEPLLRYLAFYLPQFHPIPENDEWWGPGFTDWRNVTKGRPIFRWQYQPHLPADLGFYDLRLPEVREAQADLARQYGIYGFCYYHYWFKGKQLLDRPFREVLDSGSPDFPFLLCWANESWTNVWNAGDRSTIMAQEYSADDDIDHIRWLLRAFGDARYVRVDGKPVFLVYRPTSLPDGRRTLDLWREEAARLGAGELYLCAVTSFGEEHDPKVDGYDAVVEFQPYRNRLGARRGVGSTAARSARRLVHPGSRYRRNYVFDYENMVRESLDFATPSYVRFRCVTPSWDNSSRRADGGARILRGSTPERYGEWLEALSDTHVTSGTDDNLFFVNAWNEWAEGNHLEPCLRWGRGYLEQHLRVRRYWDRTSSGPASGTGSRGRP